MLHLILPFFVKELEDAMQRGEIIIDDPRVGAYFSGMVRWDH
jgi:hypothetical protein